MLYLCLDCSNQEVQIHIIKIDPTVMPWTHIALLSSDFFFTQWVDILFSVLYKWGKIVASEERMPSNG